MKPFTLHRGDCLEVLRGMADNSVDSIVTDPPYGLSFMGKRWDYDVPGVEVWAECLRVLKPGGYLLSFGGTRTYHRLATRVEDAGFTLHPLLAWVFGSGFPKATRVELPDMEGFRYGLQSLKPAIEPICMAQKPFSEKTGVLNIARWGVGAVHIDACRVPTGGEELRAGAGGVPCRNDVDTPKPKKGADTFNASELGRWPANLIHDGSDEVEQAFPHTKSGKQAEGGHVRNSDKTRTAFGEFKGQRCEGDVLYGDEGSAARFFYCAKASRKDRNEGCEHLDRKPLHWSSGDANPGSFQSEGTDKSSQNNHPTVKPTALMAYLLRLVTPLGGLALDPYMGSGSTGKAAMREGFRFIGCELSAEYLEIARSRIEHEWRKTLPPEPVAEFKPASPQADLFAEAAP